MPRIPYADATDITPEFQTLLSAKYPLNLYRMLPRTGAAASGFIYLGGALLRDGALDAQLREIAILRVGVLSKAAYEVHQHTRIARKTGLSDEKIAAIHEGPAAAAFAPRERLVMRYTDDVVANVKAGDALFNEVVAAFGGNQAAELTMIIGFYMMVSRFLENFEIPVEDFVK